MKTKKFIVGCSLALLSFFENSAFAATRTAHFTQSGRNVTEVGIGEAATSNCKVTLVNPSNVTQNYSLVARLQVSGTHASSAPTQIPAESKTTTSASAITCTAGATSTSGSSSSSEFTCSGSLAANVGVTFTFRYPTYGTKPSGTTAGAQTVSCSGTITATDASATAPGFILATGNLTIFSETGELETDSSTSLGTTVDFGGQAVYSQIPIVINRSRPF